MRTRLLKPEFWSDETMADLPDATRLTYMGLWCLADDAGWLVLNVRQVAADLYRYQSAPRREKRVGADIDRLVAAGRVVVHECRRHAVIPTLGAHRIKGGKQSNHVLMEHRARCGDVSPVTGQVPVSERYLSESVSESGSVSEKGVGIGVVIGVGTAPRSRREQDRGETTEFQRRVPRPVEAHA